MYKYIPQGSKFYGRDVPEKVRELVNETLERKPEWYPTMERDHTSHLVMKALFYSIASRTDAKPTMLRVPLNRVPMWETGILGDLNMCASLSSVYLKLMGVQVESSNLFVLISIAKSIVTKRVIKEASDDEIEVFWWMIDPVICKDLNPEDKRSDCLKYYA